MSEKKGPENGDAIVEMRGSEGGAATYFRRQQLKPDGFWETLEEGELLPNESRSFYLGDGISVSCWR